MNICVTASVSQRHPSSVSGNPPNNNDIDAFTKPFVTSFVSFAASPFHFLLLLSPCLHTGKTKVLCLLSHHCAVFVNNGNNADKKVFISSQRIKCINSALKSQDCPKSTSLKNITQNFTPKEKTSIPKAKTQNNLQLTEMSNIHHSINITAQIPTEYQLPRTDFEVYGPPNPLNRRHASRAEQANLDDFMTGTRSGDINRFWAQDQFMINCTMKIRGDQVYTRRPLSDETYRRIIPALRLATILMERNVDLWCLILYAQEKWDYTRQDRWLDEANFDIKHYHRTEFFTNDLSNITRMTMIGYDTTCTHHEMAASTIIWAAPPHQARRMKFGIGCSYSVWEPFTNPTDTWRNTPHEDKCRAWVHMAITLVHEFAHVLQMYRDRDVSLSRCIANDAAPFTVIEPRVPPHGNSELGELFEIKTFGGLMGMVERQHAWRNCTMRTIFDYGNMLDIPQIRITQMVGSDTGTADISPETMVNFMQESTWANGRAVDLYLWRHR